LRVRSNPKERIFAPIEIKIVTQINTEDVEMLRQSFSNELVIEMSLESDEFPELVWKTAYRGQVLRHAVVYDADCVVFFVASSAEILYLLVINVLWTVHSVNEDVS
jgi:hypothetical protein